MKSNNLLKISMFATFFLSTNLAFSVTGTNPTCSVVGAAGAKNFRVLGNLVGKLHHASPGSVPVYWTTSHTRYGGWTVSTKAQCTAALSACRVDQGRIFRDYKNTPCQSDSCFVPAKVNCLVYFDR